MAQVEVSRSEAREIAYMLHRKREALESRWSVFCSVDTITSIQREITELTAMHNKFHDIAYGSNP